MSTPSNSKDGSASSQRPGLLIFLFALCGCAIVSLLATFQATFVFKVPLRPLNYLIPGLVGSVAGVLLARFHLRNRRMIGTLRQSEMRYRTLFEDAHELIQRVSAEGLITYVNPAWVRRLGYAQEELSGISIFDILHPECRGQCRQTFERLLRGERIERIEAIFIARDGTSLPVEGSVSIIFEEDGTPAGSWGIFRDIADRKRSEAALKESEERYRSLVENIDLGISLIDRDFRIVMTNAAQGRFFGKPVCDFVQRECFREFEKRENTCPHCPGIEAMSTGRPAVTETVGTLDDGRRFHALIRAFPIFDSVGSVSGFIEVVEDISLRKKTEEELRKSAEFAKTVLDSMNDAVSIINVSDFRIAGVNRVFLKELGLREEEVLGKTCHQITHALPEPCSLPDHSCPLLDTAADGKFSLAEHVHYLPDGTRKYVEVSTSPIRDSNGRINQVVHVARDITDRKQAEDKIQRLAFYDTLTGLPNRLLLHDRLHQAMAQARRDGRPLAVLFLDLDRFKGINDSLGHAFGDELLRCAAQRLRDFARGSDTVSRLGGDEFVLVLPSLAHEDDLPLVAKKILKLLSGPVRLGEHEVFSTCSIGIAVFPEDGEDVDSLLKNADTAMYVAKERGRDTYQFFSEEMNVRVVGRLALETDLRKALERNEFFLCYQPQLDLQTGGTIGVEALLRWRHPERGVVTPDEFIELAEETGLILPIGEWVLRTACHQGRQWQMAGFPSLRMAVNLSARQFKHQNLVGTVEKALADSGMDPDLLELELTESTIMENADGVIETLTDLRVRGIHLTIDDFGTGYSSLSYLKNFPIERIKIAQSFVRDVPRNSDDAAIVEAIIAVARSLNLQVIAEGVESLEQLEFLSSRHCHEVQGFYFSRPLTAPQLLQCLRDTATSHGFCLFRCND